MSLKGIVSATDRNLATGGQIILGGKAARFSGTGRGGDQVRAYMSKFYCLAGKIENPSGKSSIRFTKEHFQ